MLGEKIFKYAIKKIHQVEEIKNQNNTLKGWYSKFNILDFFFIVVGVYYDRITCHILLKHLISSIGSKSILYFYNLDENLFK